MENQFPSQTHGSMVSARTMGATSSEVSVPKAAQEMAKASLEEFTAGAKYRTPSAADLKTEVERVMRSLSVTKKIAEK